MENLKETDKAAIKVLLTYDIGGSRIATWIGWMPGVTALYAKITQRKLIRFKKLCKNLGYAYEIYFINDAF